MQRRSHEPSSPKVAAKNWSTKHARSARLQAAEDRNQLEPGLRRLDPYGLIIVDELGYLPLERQAANLHFASGLRLERGSLVVTCNRGFEARDEFLGDAMITGRTAQPRPPDRRRVLRLLLKRGGHRRSLAAVRTVRPVRRNEALWDTASDHLLDPFDGIAPAGDG